MPTRRLVFIVLGIFLGAGALLFVSVNKQLVEVDLYIHEPVQLPLWLVMFTCLVVGWLGPRLLAIWRWFGRTRERVKLRRRVALLEAELLELRNLALDLDSMSPPMHTPPVTYGRRMAEGPLLALDVPVGEVELLPRSMEQPLLSADISTGNDDHDESNGGGGARQ